MNITINRVAEGGLSGRQRRVITVHNEPLILKIHKESFFCLFRRNPENEIKRDYEEY